MRIDARDGYRGLVWHVPKCQEVKRCVWVDTDTAQYGCWPDWKSLPALQLLGINLEGLIEVHKAKKIVFYPKKNLILIDPIEDSEPEVNKIVTEKLEQQK